MIARRNSASASRCAFHSGDSITMSTLGRARRRRATRRVRGLFVLDFISFPGLRMR
jgi:hypothetical protein